MTTDKHLLVPIKVQALVIDDLVIEKKAILKLGAQRNVANDGKWSPQQQDYRRLTNALGTPNPPPFYGASRTAWKQPADQLVLAQDSPALPEMKDRGVYLHWVLPSGLRHAHKPGVPDFPALPDQWLIVRFSRRGAEATTKAWFLDSGLVSNHSGPANLLIAQGNKYVAQRVGKAVPLDQFTPSAFQGERTIITALGNQHTGSPTFTAFVAENRNILSWHDDLSDLRASNNGKMPKGVALSYLLLGWYRDERNEPFTALPTLLEGKTVFEALDWRVDGTVGQPANLPDHYCMFHGMVAGINYWNPDTYKGAMLGYPGAPSVEGVLGNAPPSFKVGVGNNAEDALVSLASSEYSGRADAPNLWKALEAVLYRKPESLVGSWNAAPRDHAVHQAWFSSKEAGTVWEIRPIPRQQGLPTTEQAPPKPTPEQFAALAELNRLQAEADALGRELAALLQDLYARWWKLCEKSRRDAFANLDDEEDACRVLAERVTALRDQRADTLRRLQPLPGELAKQLTKEKELELRTDAAPRFWTPADPVIVVKNCGLPTKHAFPTLLPCRLPERMITMAEVSVNKQTMQFSNAANVQTIAGQVQTHFAVRGDVLKQLLAEASIVEQAISDLANRSLPQEQRFFAANAWRDWVNRITHDLTWTGDANNLPHDQIRFGKPGALDVPPHRLAELWGQQPWSPLFIDWQITWRPTPHSGASFDPIWQLNEHDYAPAKRDYLPAQGFTVRGRSILSPIDGRVFKEPIETLRQLLKPTPEEQGEGKPLFPSVVREILSRYQIVWDQTLAELSSTGMMGQALTGFHQTLLRRAVTLPRVVPDPARPWVNDDDLKFRDHVVKALLDAPADRSLAFERLAPPLPTAPALPFTMLRAGALQLDELWLVDDFGQWADLLQGTSAGGSAGQVFHPRIRWHEDRFVVAQPPRITQPTRLNFRFTKADEQADSVDPSLNSICGWMFYNPLDVALVLSDREGRLVGELLIQEEQGKFLVGWEAGASGTALTGIRNASLRAFAQALVEPTPTPRTRLQDLLKLIDRASERIRPAAARREAALFGRPLALVSAHLSLELFGKAWTDPYRTPSEVRPAGTGDAVLDALRIPVNLGCLHNTEDGLIGYFKSGDFRRLVPTRLPQEVERTERWASGYIVQPETDAVRVGFLAPEPLTLLMDPWGSVQAACGLVPAKTITLPQQELEKTLAQMEASLRVGPVLVHANKLAMPTPTSDKGRWHFRGPLTDEVATPVPPYDQRLFSDLPLFAAEGRLLLRNTEE